MIHENTPRQSTTIFLLGAGASYPAGIPLIDEMTDGFFRLIKPLSTYTSDEQNVEFPFGFNLGQLRQLTEYPKKLETLRKVTEYSFGKVDLEYLMSTIIRLEDDRERNLFEMTFSELKAIDKKYLFLLKQAIQMFIRTKCEKVKTVDYLSPLEGMSENQQLKIFTLNYDGTVEIFCENKRIKCTDGFDPDWNIDLFDRNIRIHLYKLHGSLYWFRTQSNKTIKVPIKGLRIPDVKYLTDESISEMMIYPSLEKNKQLGVYSWLSQTFKSELSRSDICVIVGYSFRDEDIRESIIEALSTNPNLWLVLISPNASKHKSRVFSKDEELSSRILTMDMGVIQAITDRNLNSYLNILNPIRKMESKLWASQSTSQVRLDNEWQHILKNYLRVEHHDRIKWIVNKLSKMRFSHPNNNFPDSIEGAICSKSLTYALEYQKNKNKEKMDLWIKIFVESCSAIEYRIFNIAGVLSTHNPVKRSDLPDWYMDGGNTPKDQVTGLRDEIKKIELSTLDNQLKAKLTKFSETLDQLCEYWETNEQSTYFSKTIDGYKTGNMGLKKWSTEIANSLK